MIYLCLISNTVINSMNIKTGFVIVVALMFSKGAFASEDDSFLVAQPSYASGLKLESVSRQECGWSAKVIDNLVKSGKGKIAVKPELLDKNAKSLTWEVIQLDLPPQDSKRKIHLVVRANVLENGVLIASKDFRAEDKFSSSKSDCVALNELVQPVSDDMYNWLSEGEFPICHQGCVGIHPDDPIVVDTIVEAKADVLADEIKSECHWQTYMPSDIISRFNAQNPRPRALLQKGKTEGVKTGRRLYLTVNDLHVIGGAGFSGPKWIQMEGVLYDGGLRLGGFSAEYSTKLGKWTTCSQLKAMSDELVEKIVDWLDNPVDHAIYD